jgi:alkanesulfonate monooxygenase SsuD/methylene tetrahydromethanopterin reductase-like flavin-dependent oxidoreductase (luciferase family)
VNVGVYFDLRNPGQWGVDPTRLYGFTLEMCEEAESLGCHSVWLTEHHLFSDGYLTQPLTMAAAIAARTRTCRIGTGIVIGPLHHPVELAEQAAVVDILSGGRLDLGLGAGYRIPEFDLYGVDISRRYELNDSRPRELRRLWEEVLTPAPVQKRIPLWLGYQGPKGARRAGLMGELLLSADASLWDAYRGGLADGGHDPASGRMSGGINGWVSEDPERDWPVVSKHVAHMYDSYKQHMVEGTGQAPPRATDPDRLLRRRPFSSPLGYFMLGTPEDLAGRIADLSRGAPIETVYFFASVGGMPEEYVARHVRTLCTRLAPLLAGYDPRNAAA